jgi:hypothetical protein
LTSPYDPDRLAALESTRAKKLPAFLDGETLPPLRLQGGKMASKAAQMGVIARLRDETLERHDPELRDTLQIFLRGDVEALGDAIYAAWDRRNSAAREGAWATCQLALTGGAAALLGLRFLLQRQFPRYNLFRAALCALVRHPEALAGDILAWSLAVRLQNLEVRAQEFLYQRAAEAMTLAQEEAFVSGYGHADAPAAFLLLRAAAERCAAAGLSRSEFAARGRREGALEGYAYQSVEDAQGRLLIKASEGAVEHQVYPLEAPTGGEGPRGLSLRAVGVLGGAWPLPGDVAREVAEGRAGLIESLRAREGRFLRALAEADPRAGWSALTFAALCRAGVVYRLALGGCALQQEGGPLALLHPDGSLRDLRGELVALDPWRLVRRVPQTAEARAVAARWHEAWVAALPAALPEGPAGLHHDLAELRALLYDTPGAEGWAKMAQALTQWGDASTLEAAVEYLRGPLEAAWGAVAREAPAHWLGGAAMAQQPLVYAPGDDPRLGLCDVLRWRFAGDRSAPALAWGEGAQLKGVREVVVHGPRHDNGMPINVNMAHLRALLELPCWGAVERLQLELRFPAQVARRELGRCAFLGTLRRLTLPAFLNNPAPILALLEAGALPALEELCLTEPRQRLGLDQAVNHEMQIVVGAVSRSLGARWRLQAEAGRSPERRHVFLRSGAGAGQSQ